ncbi:14387_t:CDS:2, partial [Racocetra persica]
YQFLSDNSDISSELYLLLKVANINSDKNSEVYILLILEYGIYTHLDFGTNDSFQEPVVSNCLPDSLSTQYQNLAKKLHLSQENIENLQNKLDNLNSSSDESEISDSDELDFLSILKIINTLTTKGEL